MELLSFLHHKKTPSVSKAKKGDKEAFLGLIDENRLNIYRVARGILGNEQDIEDALQNTLIKALRNIDTLKNNDYFRTWIIRILINECKDILRRNKKITFIESLGEEEKYHDKYENMDLTRAVNSLSEELRITTVLFYFEDMSIKEIAQFLCVPEGTVTSRLTRARGKLKEIIGEV